MSMETSGFRSDHHHHSHHNHHHQSHVPQQSRRDKLRVQHGLNHFDNLDHHQHEFTFHQDQINNNVRHHNNFLYDHHQAMVSNNPSEILDFSRSSIRNTNSLTCHDMSHDVPQSFMINWNNNRSLNNPSINNDMAVAPSLENWPVVAATRPRSCNNNVVAQPCIDVGQKYYLEGIDLASTHSSYNNNDDNIVTVASTRDMMRSENELALLPFSFANIDNSTSTSTTHHQNWKDQEDHHHQHHLRTTIVNDTNLQGLSLSLSSINPSNSAAATLPGLASSDSDQDMPKPAPIPKPSIISKSCGKSLQDIVGVSSSGGYRSNTGPLGPFTGYATILRSSRFLKPAQQLLDEFCGSKLPAMSKAYVSSSERLSGDVGVDDHMDQDQVVAIDNNNNVVNTCSGSSSTFYGSSNNHEMNNSCDQRGGGIGSSSIISFDQSRPEHVQQKKAKLLYMQEEVSRRYKQYKQQMQMVVSSFESVAGLSSATPYISLALKAVSRHFRCLKSAIAEQLNHTRRALGEDYLLSSTPTVSTSKASSSSLRLKYMDQQSSIFQNNNNKPSGGGSGTGNNMAFHEPQQHHIWRPQRGLPERSVAVLRAWLFDHFLHPYPTDTDKHMLATQTGLTRNQVSNWFINARVRVWKPMVEEIHTLETKGQQADQANNNINKFDDGLNIIPSSSSNEHQAQASSTNKLGNIQLEANFSAVGHTRSSVLLGADPHDEHTHEKRSRLECSSAQSPPGSVVQGFVPYHRTGLEVWSRAEQ